MNYYIYCPKNEFNSNYSEAINEFQKRLSVYCSCSLCLNQTLQFPKKCTSSNHHFIRIHNKPSSYSSEEFANVIQNLQQSGKSNIHVVIGFSKASFYEAYAQLKESPSVETMSLTRASLHHDILTLLFHEQLYRGYTILQGKTYHK